MIGHNNPPAAIQATFSDWRTVKSRKALQLILEVPIEQTEAVLTALGAPMPDRPKWVAVALLQEPEEDEQPKPEGPRRRWHEMPASQQAGMTCLEEAFRQWHKLHYDADMRAWALNVRPPSRPMTGDAARNRAWICCRLRIKSLRDLDTDPIARAKWDALVSRYRQETGREAERR